MATADDRAEQYAELIDAGFDLTPLRGKEAFRKDWRQFESSDEVQSYYKEHPDENAGILTGAAHNNLFVIDVDMHNDDGYESLRAWEAEHGTLTDTATVATGGNGLHMYYHAPDGVAVKCHCGKGALFPGLECKGDGGLVVAPGSIHPDTGNVYLWEQSPDDVPIATANELVLSLVIPSGKADDDAEPFEVPEVIPEGSRHDSLFRMASSLRGKSFSHAAALAAVKAENLAKCEPPYSDAEVSEIVDDVFTRYPSGLSAKYRERANYSLSPAEPELVKQLQELDAARNFSRDQLGAGRLFARLFGGELRFNTTTGSWLCYGGGVWDDKSGNIAADLNMKRLADALLQYAVLLPETGGREDWQKFAKKLGRRSEREQIVKDAQSELAVDHDQLDANDDMLNVANGTLDLRTFELKPHDPGDLLTKRCNAAYIPGARSELWEKFVSDVMCEDEEKIAYLKRVDGYCLTADTSQECGFVRYGVTTRNGKSTHDETFAWTLGGDKGYAAVLSPDALAAKTNINASAANSEIARLDGARYVRVPESRKRLNLDGSLVKRYTGGDMLTARHNYQDFFEFMPRFKLCLSCNYLPLINDDSVFASGRLQVLTFDRHFAESEQDLTLKRRLQEPENLSGILNWALDGLRDLRDHGLEPPDCVHEATEDYRRKSDLIGQFIYDRLERDDGNNLKSGDVYSAYSTWATANGHPYPMTKPNFLDELRAKDMLSKSGKVDGMTLYNVVKGYRIKRDWN